MLLTGRAENKKALGQFSGGSFRLPTPALSPPGRSHQPIEAAVKGELHRLHGNFWPVAARCQDLAGEVVSRISNAPTCEQARPAGYHLKLYCT